VLEAEVVNMQSLLVEFLKAVQLATMFKALIPVALHVI
jgi:hypothetical protein